MEPGFHVTDPLELVCWEDSSVSTSWTFDRKPALMECLTAGWVICEDDDALVLGSSANLQGEFSDRVSIPKSVVRWRRPLVVVA